MTGTTAQVVTENAAGEPTQILVDVPQPDTAPIEAVEEVTDSAVEIAQINADAQVEIAQTEAAVEIARIEAEQNMVAEAAAMRERVTWLEAELANTQEQNRQLQAQLTPPSLPVEEAAEAMAEAVEEADPETLAEAMTTDTSETQTEASQQTQTEAPSESADGNPVEAAAEVAQAVKRRLRFL